MVPTVLYPNNKDPVEKPLSLCRKVSVSLLVPTFSVENFSPGEDILLVGNPPPFPSYLFRSQMPGFSPLGISLTFLMTSIQQSL